MFFITRYDKIYNYKIKLHINRFHGYGISMQIDNVIG